MEEESYLVNNLNIYNSHRCDGNHCYKTDPGMQCNKLKLNQFLFEKYSSSQNYYYTKEINNILSGVRTPAVFNYTDNLHYLEDENLLKRIYKVEEYPKRIEMLTEYYKYHEDVPRLFMKPVASTVHNYYDKKRRINYIKITRMLKEQNPDMTDSRQITEVHIHDTSSNISLEHDDTVPKSLYKFLPDEISAYNTKDLDETSGRREKMISSVTVHDLNGVLEGIFNIPQRNNKYSSERRLFKLSGFESELSLSFRPSELQQYSTKCKAGLKIDLKDFIIDKKLFSSNLVNEYISKGLKSKKKINPDDRVTQVKKPGIRLNFEEEPKSLFKKKNKETIQDVKDLKLSLLKNEAFLQKLISKNLDPNNGKKKNSQQMFILNSKNIKKAEDDKKLRNLNINNFNINININGTNKSNRISKDKNNGPLVIDIPKDRPKVKVNIDSPNFSIKKIKKVKIDNSREIKGKSINFASIRKWNSSCDNNIYTANSDKYYDHIEFPSRVKGLEDFISINHVRKSMKDKPSFGTCYFTKQSNNMNTLKASMCFKKNESVKCSKKKGKSITDKKLTKNQSPKMKITSKPPIVEIKEPKASFRKTSENVLKYQINNPINFFMSQDFKESKNKSIGVIKKNKKSTKGLKKVNGNCSPDDKQKIESMNLIDQLSASKGKYSTFGTSLKSKCEDGTVNPQFNTLTFINLFNKKKSGQGNTTKTNIENSIKGKLIRKVSKERFSNEHKDFSFKFKKEPSENSERESY